MELNKPIKDALAYLCATFRATVDTWQARAYIKTLEDLPPAHVMRAAEVLVAEAAAGRKFYPLPTAPEWRKACLALLDEERKKMATTLLADCTHDGGWEQFETEDGWIARRCACHKAAMAAIRQLAPGVAPVAQLDMGVDDGHE